MVSQLSLLDWAGLAATAAGAALPLHVDRLWLRGSLDPGLSAVCRSACRQSSSSSSFQPRLSITATLPGLWRAIAPALLLRLTLGSIAGLPLGLIALRPCRSGRRPPANRSHDPGLYRGPRLGQAPRTGQEYGAAGHETQSRPCSRRDIGYRNRARRNGGSAGPDLSAARRNPAANRARDTSSRFSGSSTRQRCSPMRSPSASPASTWIGAGVLIPFAALGAIAGRPLGDRLGVRGFAVLAIVLLATAGLYTLAASAGPATRQ